MEAIDTRVSNEKTLFELLFKLRELDDGEADAAIEEIAGVISDVRRKVDAYKFVIDQLEGQALIVKERVDALNKIKSRVSKNVARIKERLMEVMEQNETTILEGYDYRVAITKTRGSVTPFQDDPSVDDAWNYPEFVRTTIAWDKTAIGNALKLNDKKAMEVAEVQQGKSIRFTERLES